MVNDLRSLLRENVAEAPADDLDIASVVTAGRRRARMRRTALLGGTAALVAVAVVAGVALAGADSDPDSGAADRDGQRRLEPVGPVLNLSDARQAIEGEDYRLLATYTNENLDRNNGQYFSGVTDDGQILYTDGPHGLANTSRIALTDPGTGEKDWLPDRPGLEMVRPLELSADRLVLTSNVTEGNQLKAEVFDRKTGTWSSMAWPALPVQGRSPGYSMYAGPDDRLYVGLSRQPDEQGGYDLWSVSLDDSADVRDEHLVVGDFNITGDLLTWTDGVGAAVGNIHVRNLATGEETSFDPGSGDRCNHLSLSRTERFIVLGQYCGTVDGVRDDRIQIITADGDPVVTVQDDGVDGAMVADSVVAMQSYSAGDDSGGYVYDLDSGRLLRVSDSLSKFGLGGPTPGDLFMWHTPVNNRHGATQWLGELL